MTKTLPATAAAAFLSLAAGAASACATCGCSLSTDAATGYPTQPGWTLSLQFDEIGRAHV